MGWLRIGLASLWIRLEGDDAVILKIQQQSREVSVSGHRLKKKVSGHFVFLFVFLSGSGRLYCNFYFCRLLTIHVVWCFLCYGSCHVVVLLFLIIFVKIKCLYCYS